MHKPVFICGSPSDHDTWTSLCWTGISQRHFNHRPSRPCTPRSTLLRKKGCPTHCFSLLVCGWKLLVFYWWWNCFLHGPNIQLENPVSMGRVLTSHMCIYMYMYVVQQQGHTSTMNALLSRGLPTLSVLKVSTTRTHVLFSIAKHPSIDTYTRLYMWHSVSIHFVFVFCLYFMGVVCWVRVSFLSSLPLWLP